VSVFADSSALVKLYADETGADEVRALGPLVIAELARVEVPAALWRKQRTGELSAADAQLLVADFEADYFGVDGQGPRFAAVRTSADVLDAAAKLVAVHGLRAYDAVQLSCALAAHVAVVELTAMAAFDQQLRAAAAAEGLAVLP
jgi:predicted nucleic acid-binding protein